MGWLNLGRARPAVAVPDSLTADARPIDLRANLTTGKGPGNANAWQAEAWARFDEIGELRAVAQWFANSLSRVRLVASDIDPATGHPTGATDDAQAATMVADIAGGPAGQAAMLSRLATFLTVPGEVWVTIIDRPGEGEQWHVLADSEITTMGDLITITLPDGSKHELEPDRDTLFRIHRPHPRTASEADSPVRAALPILREIRRCEQTIEAAGKSRVAGNGILALPHEISMPTALAPQADPDAPGLPAPDQPDPSAAPVRSVSADQLMGAIQQAMTTAIQDQSSAAAMVPIVIQAAGEHIDKIKHISLASDQTEVMLKTREASIRRLALALDIPPEVLLGVSDTNHWNGWLSQDQAINQHLAPMMTLICDALTTTVLRPLLERQHHPAPDQVVVWFDMSDLARRPDRREDAAAAFDRGVISATAYRQELGYGDDDAPDLDTDEARRELAAKMVTGAPSLFPILAPYLGMEAGAATPSPVNGAPTPAPPRSTQPVPATDPRRGA